MFDLADSLIGKANQIEESCHISFFSEFKKKPALPSDKNRQSRLALNSPFHFPLRRTPCVPPVWPQIMLEAVSMMGEANYDATDIICDSAVKYVLFQLL
jgi:hypothetical protein